ncbi:uncharacterized protein LOC143571588 [Bidens hawaiensis]|uniref:uncharacterized protein LOC143571588 n=1 Tax=Bidens hawaiensis TaxID=980011 RepID=UPI004049365B
MHYGRVDNITNSLKFPLVRRCKMGEQCYLTYGNLSSSHLITFYGFLPKGDNPYNVIPLDFDLSEVDNTDETRHVSNWSTHMVRAMWLSSNHGMLHYGLPRPLLECLREARGLFLQSDVTVHEKLEVESEILEDLQSTFDSMLENLGETEARENCEWDVKLALDYKDLQRQIIASIVNSCYAGRQLVENELQKYTNND